MNVLSIQSHVIYGHVGNSAAVFTLQRMGHEAWPVHTVLFSNHPGYGSYRGCAVPPDLVEAIIDGLEELGVLARCDAVLSGYLGDPMNGRAVQDAVARVRASNPAALYLCDPVMGDHEGGIYVRDGIVEAFKDELIAVADIVTPNVFELELLTGRKVTGRTALVDALGALREAGPRTVVASGLPEEESAISSFAVDESGAMSVTCPRLETDARPDGAGDLFAALLLGNLLDGCALREALARVVGSVYGIFEASINAESRELRLIEAQAELVAPTRIFPVRILG